MTRSIRLSHPQQAALIKAQHKIIATVNKTIGRSLVDLGLVYVVSLDPMPRVGLPVALTTAGRSWLGESGTYERETNDA